MVDICLELAGAPLEWRLHLIEHNDGVSNSVQLAAEPADAGWDPAAQKSLNKYGRDDSALVQDGVALFSAISKGEIGREWKRLRRKHDGALRTFVRFSAPGTAHLPCELVIDGLTPLVTEGPLIRTTQWMLPADTFKPVWPVRVFVVNAADPNDKAIQADEEIWNIREALRKSYHSFDLEVYETAGDPDFKIGGMIDAMKRWPGGPHILHFIGHSVPTDLKLFVVGRGATKGVYKPWSLMAINVAVSQLPQLRLVYVNACRSNVAGGDPASAWSVADAFLEHAVAVVAMQADISGTAAQLCAGAFYKGLAAGAPIDDAFLAARVELATEFGEKSIEVYAPVLTTRVAAPCILPTRCFDFPAAHHANWQSMLTTTWTHFVNQHVARRSLISALCEPAPGASGVVVWGDGEVGKSWLVNWSSYAVALTGVQVHYIKADKPPDWLQLLRCIRDGNATLASPALDVEIRNEFNWKLNHLAQGRPPPAYAAVPGQTIEDNDDSLKVILARGLAINGFDGLVCEAFVHALRQQAQVSPRVLILDNPPLPVTTILKKPLLDVLAQRKASEPARIIVCCQTELWKSYQLQALDFSTWSQIPMGPIEPHQVTRLIPELLRLLYPASAKAKPELHREVEKILADTTAPPPMTVREVYEMCRSIGRRKGLYA